MKSSLRGFAGNLLFTLNIFIIFLLLFENLLVLPHWLQAFGRMHPMLLHFPIVIIMLSMVLEFFRFRPQYNNQELYQSFTSNLLLIGALSAAVTVIMGLFLSKEGGYTGSTLQWHKWTGASIAFITSLIYWARSQPWYKAPVAKSSAVLASLCLILAGHYGATITHGVNFVLGPVSSGEQRLVPIDQAVVFDNLVMPVFQKKCISCHNEDKVKGNLILTDMKSILAGGKNGKLFVPGKPEISLLLQRIHLPEDEKKHMPPAGKTQLTPDEVTLLHLWIKNNADFKKKVIELPVKDSLRILAAVLLKPTQPREEQFDFAAADKETVRKLNNDYRVVYALSKESPALAVNIYNKNAYSKKSLDDLSAVKTQVVSLELNKMPVKDADLKSISQFENLRTLNLNFTDVTGTGLKDLTTLQHLQSLSLSGTSLSFQDLLQQMRSFKSLNTLTVWDTGLTDAEMQELQKSNKNIDLITGFKDDGSNPIQLNPPSLKNSSNIFNDQLSLQLKHTIKGVDIRFTTDGTEPDSINSRLFKNETVLHDNLTTIKAKAYKEGWYGSNVSEFTLYKSSFKPDSMLLLFPLNPVHQANGAKTFFDREMGTFNANSPAWANNWAGFRNYNMELVLLFNTPILLSSVGLNTMLEPKTGIYPASVIEIWGGKDKNDAKLLSTVKPEIPEKDSEHVIKVFESTFKPQTVSYIKIVARTYKIPPDTKNPKGKNMLLLIDEAFLN
ncbi:MAG: c-type cytochrome domain-containing protein [Chitinophagaceae bacterium]